MRPLDRPDGRLNLALVLASLHTGSSQPLWPAVAEAAARADSNLFIFPGGRIGRLERWEVSRNAIYDLAAKAPLDGVLVWTSSISGSGDIAPMDAFLDRFRDIPALSLSGGVSGVPVVTIDYYGGMRDAVRHAVRHHGYESVAFLRGPATHPGAEERYRAYLDVMAETPAGVDRRLVSSPSPWDGGREATLELLDGRGLVPGRDFRALVASSDLMALWAVKLLKERGWRIPEDVAVLGMNNTQESRLSTPALTTADGPFAELGSIATSSLLDLVAGRPVPPLRELPSRLVVRGSCGCPSASFVLAASLRGEAPPAGGPALVEAIARATGATEGMGRDWIGPLVEAWEAADSGGAEEEARFYDYLERVSDRIARAGLEFGPWQCAVSLLRLASLARAEAGKTGRVEDRAGRARVILAEGVERAHVYRDWEEERRAEALRALDHELLVSFDLGRLSTILHEGLEPLGIGSAYVCRYEGADEARLIMGFRDGVELDRGLPPFPAALLAPPGVLPSRRLAYIVEPLYFHDSALGYVLLEIGPRRGADYEEIRNSISNALRGAVLVSRLDEARERAEKADEVKSLLLSNVSHELRAPALLMREAAGRLKASQRLDEGAREEVLRLEANAGQQLRLVNDLLDLSRAEIDELDLDRRLEDLKPLLASVFADYAASATPDLRWELDLPERLPLAMVDAVRLRQICSNLLDNARKFTTKGSIRLEAEATATSILVRVRDSGRGIEASRLARIFEPFVSAGPSAAEGEEEGGPSGKKPAGSGAGLGLGIARHLAILHLGSLEVESLPGSGSTFTLSLPLPNLEGLTAARVAEGADCLVAISRGEAPSPALAELAAKRGLSLRVLGPADLAPGALGGIKARAIAWDLEEAEPGQWALFRRLRQDPRFMALPFLLFTPPPAGEAAGPVGFVAKGGSLAEALALACPSPGDEPCLAADDDPASLDAMRAALALAIPGVEILTATDGEEAWRLASARPPRLALLDLRMPGLSALDLVERFRADDRLFGVPVIIATNKVITAEDIRRVEGHARVYLQNKGILGPEEAASRIAALLEGEALPAPSSATARKALAYLNERYTGSLSRWKIAEALNVNEDHLSRVFRKEFGLSPWEYLTRLRVQKAKELLVSTRANIAEIAQRVGFADQAYFSRVFRKVTGTTPQAWRSGGREGACR